MAGGGALQLLPSISSAARFLRSAAAFRPSPRRAAAAAAAFAGVSLPRHRPRPSFVRTPQSRLQSNASGTEFESYEPLGQSEIIFLGTGTSEGIPRVSCLTNQSKTCPVCSKATGLGNRNRRRNTSILLRYTSSSGRFNILVDADAIGGLDDLRDWTNNVQPYIPIYVSKRDFEVMNKTHYYLVDTSVVVPGAAVSELQFNIIEEEPFVVHNLKVTPLPVWHGGGYRSLGFRFGDICYISDVSDIPEETYELLKNCKLLILDALRPNRSSSTHFGLPRALDEVRKIKPERTLFTGMMHLMDHDKVNEYLAKLMETEGLDVQLSYDGLRVPVNL